MGSRIVLFGQCEGKCFVEHAQLIVLLHVGLAQFLVGVALSEFKFPVVVWLAQFFVGVLLSEFPVGL